MEKTPSQTTANSLKEIDLAASFMRKPEPVSIPQKVPHTVETAPLSESPEASSVSGIVPLATSPTKRAHGSKTKKEAPYQSFTVICNKELVRKVKAIAAREGLHINDVVQTMYEEGISRYEQTHGSVDSGVKKKSAKDVLFTT